MSALVILRSLAALAAVLALLAGGLWIAKRRGLVSAAGFRRADRRLAVVERLALDPKRQLLLIRLDAAEYLILLTPDGAQPIPPATLPASGFDSQALKARWQGYADRQKSAPGKASLRELLN